MKLGSQRSMGCGAAWLVAGAAIACGGAAGLAQTVEAPPFGTLTRAATPNDAYFPDQWHLENRDANGFRLGVDLNARWAWGFGRGAGVVVAVVDNGVETGHPDLAANMEGAPHFNFDMGVANGDPQREEHNHGTAVAGLIAAAGGNGRGISGIAPEARLASWVIYKTNASSSFVAADKMAAMFRHENQRVAVQNHSWAQATLKLVRPSAAEEAAIGEATRDGREGKGVVMVRAAGNIRVEGRNANDDAYVSDPRVIAVGAARSDGRVASYSNPGPCLLVGAPSGDTGFNFRSLLTTDRAGSARGYNQINFNNDLADYVFGSLGFEGTSASAPLVSGICALMLSANPALSHREAQQILILASRHWDLADPDLRATGAGFLFSHNLGFGIPDAALAVTLARQWPVGAAPLRTVERDLPDGALAVPDAGLRLAVAGEGVPEALRSIVAAPGLGPLPISWAAPVPLADVGDGFGALPPGLAGKAALIRRGGGAFADKIANVARAGAVLAVVYNNEGTDEVRIMGGTDFSAVPAVFVGKSDGEALAAWLAGNPGAQAGLSFAAAEWSVEISDSLSLEHVGLTLNWAHARRGDLRVELISPSGAVSVMQRIGGDDSAVAEPWTFYSTQHFFEPSAGTWRARLLDQLPGNTGSCAGGKLLLRGRAIADGDRDGLPDDWELARLGSISWKGVDDSDGDGLSNMVEWILKTDPASAPAPGPALRLQPAAPGVLALSWPSHPFQVRSVVASEELRAGVAGEIAAPAMFPETRLPVPTSGGPIGFFWLK